MIFLVKAVRVFSMPVIFDLTIRPCDNKVANLAARLVNLVAQPCSYKVGYKVEIWNYKVRCKVEMRFGSMRIWGNIVDQLFCIEWRRF